MIHGRINWGSWRVHQRSSEDFSGDCQQSGCAVRTILRSPEGIHIINFHRSFLINNYEQTGVCGRACQCSTQYLYLTDAGEHLSLIQYLFICSTITGGGFREHSESEMGVCECKRGTLNQRMINRTSTQGPQQSVHCPQRVHGGSAGVRSGPRVQGGSTIDPQRFTLSLTTIGRFPYD